MRARSRSTCAISGKCTREHYQQRWKIENFLSDIKANCVPQEYVGHLNALVDVSNEVLNYYSLEKALDERLKEWRIHPGVRKWSQEKFKYVLNKWFNKLNEDDYLFLAHVRSFDRDQTYPNKFLGIKNES